MRFNKFYLLKTSNSLSPSNLTSSELSPSAKEREHELNTIKCLDFKDIAGLVSLGHLNPKKGINERLKSQTEQKVKVVGKCINFKRCKGEGNTNRYSVCKTHRKVTYCPFGAKVC